MHIETTDSIYEPEGTINEEDLLEHLDDTILIGPSVTSIVEGAFAHGQKPMKIVFKENPFFTISNGLLVDEREKKILSFNGNQKVVRIPSFIHSIGSWAFYECAVDQIIFEAEISNIHAYAFSTCCLKEAVFPFEETHIFFPQRDIRLRQYMLEGFGENGMFDFEKYDEGIAAGYIEPERMREITARLKWPYALSSKHQERYRKIFRDHFEEAVQAIGRADDLEVLKWLSELNIINSDNSSEALKALHALKNLHAYMEFSRFLNKSNVNNTFDFTI